MFPTTAWSDILARKSDPAGRRELAGAIWKAYRHPLRIYLRARGLADDQVDDTLASFFVRLVEHDFVARLDPRLGRLRGFLVVSLGRHLADLGDTLRAKKRNAGAPDVLLDDALEHASDPATSPDLEYDRAWAAVILGRAFERLREEFERGSRRGPFEIVVEHFRCDATPSIRELAARHRLGDSAVKSLLARARARFHRLVRDEIALLVADPDQVEDELQHLLDALRADR